MRWIESVDAELVCTQEMAKSLVGMPERDASKCAAEGGRIVRVGQRDQVGFPLTDDFNPRRVTIFVRDNIVTRAEAT